MELASKLLAGKTALITGSNRGIGRAVLFLFAQNGADIYACARDNTEEFTELLNEVKLLHNVKIEPLYFDLSSEKQIKNALKVLITGKVKIDILVNNAAVAHGGLLQMVSMTKIKEIFEINFFSQVLIIQQISKLMMKYKSGDLMILNKHLNNRYKKLFI